MALQLFAPTLAIKKGLPITFTAQGGTAPYTYSVSDGVGSVNSLTGEYVSSQEGSATIQVVDSLSAVATLTILVGSALELFCDIIKQEMELDSDQVYLWDQKIDIPKDSRLYIAVGVLTLKPFGNNSTFDSDGNEFQSINIAAMLSVDFLSRNLDAVSRKEEILMALASNYSESQQEFNSFYVGKISTAFVNLSQVDGAAIPYRFNISVAIQYVVSKVKPVPYYDTFDDAEVTTES